MAARCNFSERNAMVEASEDPKFIQIAGVYTFKSGAKCNYVVLSVFQVLCWVSNRLSIVP